jgi:hypothetical protein
MTVAAETTTTQSEPAFGPGEFAIGDVLAALNAEPATESTDDGGSGGGDDGTDKASKAGKGAKSTGPGKAEAKSDGKATSKADGKAEPPEEDFSDERPWTPERIKSAVHAARALHDKSVKMWSTTEKRLGKLQEARDSLVRAKEQFKVDVSQFQADVQACRKGDAKSRLAALGRLFNGDGAAVFEELTLELAQNGKKAEESPGEKRLRAELDELKARLKKQDDDAELARQEEFVAQRKQQLADMAGADGERWPLLAEHATDNPAGVGAALAEIITQEYHRSKGRRVLTDEEAADRLEADLAQEDQINARARSKREQGPATLQKNPERGTGSPRASESRTAPSSPPNRGRSLSPGLATAASHTRELTDEELEDDAADFIPAALLRMANPNAGI